ncbi:hypothetical protein PR048_005149 [Dryococelus australis]|uniref:Uncharacterized protein n=1 Tax=Dryococelus australis TaxID=614101 RepID=A0ABQ9I9I4_9NEOP|nr:hypothetical protein PR048_005149 [Dryococelus australis]
MNFACLAKGVVLDFLTFIRLAGDDILQHNNERKHASAIVQYLLRETLKKKTKVSKRNNVIRVEKLQVGETVLKASEKREDDCRREIMERVKNVEDLVAEDARYYLFVGGNCSDEAMERIKSYLKENSDKYQFALDDLIAKENRRKKTVVCLRKVGYGVLSQSWYEHQKSDPQEEKPRIIDAAADIRSDIHSLVYEFTEYMRPDNLLSYIGKEGITGIVGNNFEDVQFKRKNKFVTQAYITNNVKVGNHKLTADPLILFHRPCIAKQSEEELKELSNMLDRFIANVNNKKRFIDLLKEVLEEANIHVGQAVEDADVFIVNTAIYMAPNYDAVLVHPELQGKAKACSNPYATNEELAEFGENFLVEDFVTQDSRYSASQNLDELRYHDFVKAPAKTNFHLSRLLYTRDAARLHAIRTYHQSCEKAAAIILDCNEQDVDTPLPIDLIDEQLEDKCLNIRPMELEYTDQNVEQKAETIDMRPFKAAKIKKFLGTVTRPRRGKVYTQVTSSALRCPHKQDDAGRSTLSILEDALAVLQPRATNCILAFLAAAGSIVTKLHPQGTAGTNRNLLRQQTHVVGVRSVEGAKRVREYTVGDAKADDTAARPGGGSSSLSRCETW